MIISPALPAQTPPLWSTGGPAQGPQVRKPLTGVVIKLLCEFTLTAAVCFPILNCSCGHCLPSTWFVVRKHRCKNGALTEGGCAICWRMERRRASWKILQARKDKCGLLSPMWILDSFSFEGHENRRGWDSWDVGRASRGKEMSPIAALCARMRWNNEACL